MNKGYVYILTNERRTVLYIGCTNDLQKRLYHHKHRLIPGFSKRYNVNTLVYFEVFIDIAAARIRERKLKGITRQKKEAIIISMNPSWQDISDRIPTVGGRSSE